MTSDAFLLVAIKTDWLDKPAAQSTREYCIDCGAEVWVSLESRKAAGPKALVVCIEDGNKRAKADPEPKVQRLSEGQKREIREALDDLDA